MGEIQGNPSFSIMMDTSLRLSEIYCYCVIRNNENGKPEDLEIKQSFLRYRVVEDQSASQIAHEIFNFKRKKDSLK